MAFSKKESPNCDWCPHRRKCFFDLLDDKVSRKEWKEMRVANRFYSGDVVFYEGEKPQGLYVVCSGKVKIHKTSRTGQQLVTRVENPGDLLGHRSMLSKEAYSGNAVAMEESVLSMVEEGAVERFLLKHPKAALALLRELSKDVRRGEDKARDIAFKPARVRLGSVLVSNMHAAGGSAKPVVTGFKRKDLAEMAGLTIETTVRLLRDFEAGSLIKKKEREIVILDEAKLRGLAERS